MWYGFSAVVGEACLELLTREEYAALDCAQRQLHLFGDLAVLVAGHVHRKGYAVFVGEFVDGVGDLLGAE